MKSKQTWNSDFGIIHADLHLGNFFFDGLKLTIFDFDDSCYHWFLYDLTIPILTIMRNYEKIELQPTRNILIQTFFESYFYNRQKSLTWKEDFVQFYKYRCFFVHLWLIAIQKDRDLSDEMKINFQKAIEWEGQHPFSGHIEELLEIID